MTAYDMHVAVAAPLRRTMQLASSIHLQMEPGGGALVIDDQTLTAARLNKAAHILLQALQRPRTLEELAGLLAVAAGCQTDDAATSVMRLIDEIASLGWIEFDSEIGGTICGVPPTDA